jgi:hypothetical protein
MKHGSNTDQNRPAGLGNCLFSWKVGDSLFLSWDRNGLKARQWNISNLMTVWTVAVAIQVWAGSINPASYRIVQERIYVVQPGR